MFVWAYAYHDFQSWFILLWLMHSTLFKSTRRFIRVTFTYYLPVFILVFLFYYVINIPQVVQFAALLTSPEETDRWRSYGFYDFSLPALEVALMLAGLAPFFLLVHSRGQLEENSKEDTKRKFLQKLTDQRSPTVYYLVFVLLKNLDVVAFVTIFFSGVNKIDFYHIFLLFFFVAYILWPRGFIRHYLLLLVYVDLFVFEKYLYSLIVTYIPADSIFLPIAHVLGLSTDVDEVSHQHKYFRYPPKLQQWLLIIVVFLQYQVHQILKDEALVRLHTDQAAGHFKKRYPKLAHLWEIG